MKPLRVVKEAYPAFPLGMNVTKNRLFLFGSMGRGELQSGIV